MSAFAAYSSTESKIKYTKPSDNTSFGKYTVNIKWKTLLGTDIGNKDKSYIINKSTCTTATFTVSATQTFTYRDNNANTALALKEIVTSPSDCRTIMTYKLSGFTTISANLD